MDEKDTTLIERYLAQELAGEALADFRRRLKSEEALAAELALYEEVDMRLAAMQKEAIKTEWKAFLDENAPSTAASKKLRPLYMLSAMAAAVLLLFGIYWTLLRSTPGPLLADNYWQQTADFSYQGTERSTADSPAKNQALKKAYENFNKKDYAGAKEILATLSTPTSEMLLLTGACAYYLEDYAEAKATFQQILDTPAYLSKDEASWYLALTHLKQGEVAPAKALLETIVMQQSWNHDLAGELLEEL